MDGYAGRSEGHNFVVCPVIVKISE